MRTGELATAIDSATLRARSRPVRGFDGLTWNGVLLVAAICIVNGTRRAIQGFDETPFPEWLGQTAQMSATGLVVAVPVAAAVLVAWNLGPRRPWLRYAVLAVAVAVSSLAGAAALSSIEILVQCDGSPEACFEEPWTTAVLRAWVRYGSLSALFATVFVYLRVADESAERALDAERQRERFVQRMDEARLRVLQAQIEPHFLFNTLANLRRLYQTDPAAAASMLENLMRYLEIALPQMRATGSTVGREVALTEAFLAVQQIRMGKRLSFDIDVPSSLRDVPLPPMMVLTLVENAIKHGLAPLPEGGIIRIAAVVAGSELLVRVVDTGRGFVQTSGGGTGLANIRARLAGLYGAAGRLALTLNEPQGIVATIAIPYTPTIALEAMP